MGKQEGYKQEVWEMKKETGTIGMLKRAQGPAFIMLLDSPDRNHTISFCVDSKLFLKAICRLEFIQKSYV